MSVREVSFAAGGEKLHIHEATHLENESGAVIWDASLVLAHYLYLHAQHGKGGADKQPLAGSRIIEVGAGLGLAGLTAALLGADVVLTDLEPVLPGLRHNVKVNDLEGRATVAELRWGTAVKHLDPPFDLVLASDVAYDAAAIPKLLRTLAALAGPDTHILFAFEARPPVTDETVRALPLFGLIAEEVPQSDLHPDWRDPSIHILDITLVAN